MNPKDEKKSTELNQNTTTIDRLKIKICSAWKSCFANV